MNFLIKKYMKKEPQKTQKPEINEEHKKKQLAKKQKKEQNERAYFDDMLDELEIEDEKIYRMIKNMR